MNASATKKGRLLLVPGPLDFGCEPDQQVPLTDVLPHGVLQQAAQVTHWVCENAKTARAYLKRIDAVTPLALPLQAQQLTEISREAHKKGDHHSGRDDEAAQAWLAPAELGHDVGLLSEAGMPAVADPGSSVVRAAHGMGVEVIALPGPVSLLLALAASGLNGQQFAFVGYLPQDAGERLNRIRALEMHALKTGQTQIAIETPYRNAALQDALIKGLQPHTRLAVSAGLTLTSATTHSALISQWRQHPERYPAPGKHQPAVFAFGR